MDVTNSQLPKGAEDFQVSQALFRKNIVKGDARAIFFGMSLFVDAFLKVRMTTDSIEAVINVYKSWHSGKTSPFPEEMWRRVIKEFDGFLPIVVTGLPEGTTHYIGEPHIQVWTDVPGMGSLVSYIKEEMLPYIWKCSTVATRGRKCKDTMMKVFQECHPGKTEDQINEMVSSKYHDFGRGSAKRCTGIAHLLNWEVTNNIHASSSATNYNEGEPTTLSLPLLSKQDITLWETDNSAYESMVDTYKEREFVVTVSQLNQEEELKKLAYYSDVVKEAEGRLVAHFDLVEKVDVLVRALQVLAYSFGTTTQEKGLAVINNASVSTEGSLFDKVYPAIIKAGFCPSNVSFGMGEKDHNVTISDSDHVYKTCMVGTKDGGYRNVMEIDKNLRLCSIPCPVILDNPEERLRVKEADISVLRNHKTGMLSYFDGRPDIYKTGHALGSQSIFPIVNGNFSDWKYKAFYHWDKLDHYMRKDTFSSEIRDLQKSYIKERNEGVAI